MSAFIRLIGPTYRSLILADLEHPKRISSLRTTAT